MYKPITEYTEQELAAMRCWEILLCHAKWQTTSGKPGELSFTDPKDPLPEPYAAIYQQAQADFLTPMTVNNPEMEAWMDAHYDEIFPPEQPK